MRRSLALMAIAALVLSVALGATSQTAPTKDEKPTVIELVQTPGKFETEKLELKPGKYVFKVTNKNVEHELGFYLRQQTPDGKDGRPLPNSNPGHLKKGETKSTGVVELRPGTYVYSCPLNPTPHYTITVR